MKTFGVVAFASDIVRAQFRALALVRWLKKSEVLEASLSAHTHMWGAADLQVAGL